MTMKTKKLLSVLLVLCLALTLLPTAALAVDPAPVLYIGSNVAVPLPDNGHYINDSGGDAASGTWYVYNDNSAYTLTLNGANITTAFVGANGNKYGIYTENLDLTIALVDSSTVGGAALNTTSSNSYGICVAGDLTISGTGSLTVTGGDVTAARGNCGLLCTETLTIVSGHVTATGGSVTATSGTAASGGSWGMLAGNGLIVTGTGDVTGTGGSAANGAGVCVNAGDIEVSGTAKLTGNGGAATSGNSIGVHADQGNITVTGGTVTGTGNAAGDYSYGIAAYGYFNNGSYVCGGDIAFSVSANVTGTGGTAVKGSAGILGDGDITISGAVAVSGEGKTVSGTGEDIFSDGIIANASMAISGGTVTGIGGSATNGVSEGIYAYDDLTVSGGTVTGTGNGSSGNSYGFVSDEGTVTLTYGTIVTQGSTTAINTQPDFGTTAWYKWRLADSGDYTRSCTTSYAVKTATPYDTHVEIITDDVYIKTQPQNKTFTVGNITGTLTVEADGSPTGTPTYHWYKCANAAKDSPESIASATTASFTIPTDLTVGTYYYYCAATLNGVTADSNVATVAVNPAYSGPSYSYYAITATAGENGAVTPAGKTSVREGKNAAYAITPGEGYKIADVLVDGVSVGAVSEYTFENVQRAHTIEAVFAWGNPFEDVAESDWFYEDVEYAYLNELFEGTSPTTFAPHTAMTRGMLVTVLYRLEGEPAVTGTNPFDDVERGRYYENAVIWAAENELVGGYGNGKFGPDDDISREQMAAILWRYAKYKGIDVRVGEDTNILSYNDVASVSEYAIPAMQWACGAGLINGDNGNLMPQGNAERCQVAAILHRFCENVTK